MIDIPEQMKIVSVAEMRRLEKEADAGGHSYADMMELAGESVADAIGQEFPFSEEVPVVVLVGPGNNGGDGLVCARHLYEDGYDVKVYLWKRSTAPEDDYEDHFARLQKLDVESAHADDDGDFSTLEMWLNETDLVVDALLGTGTDRPIEGQLADLLEVVSAVRRSRQEDEADLFMVAVDCPSGLNTDSGEVDPYTVPADMTVTFAYAKKGHFLFPGAGIIGDLVIADIGIDPALAEEVQTFAISADWVKQYLPERASNSHKGKFGKAMVVVGSVNYPGAAYLSCAATARAGAGLVTGAVPQPVWVPVATALHEVTWLLLSHELGVINENAAPLINEKLGGYDALLLGCGLSQEEATQDFVQKFLTRTRSGARSVLPSIFRKREEAQEESATREAATETSQEQGSTPGNDIVNTPFGAIRRHSNLPAEIPPLPPTVIDADGLNCLAKIDGWPALLPQHAVLTPHPAEMARLCGLQVADVLAEPWALAQEKAAEWQAVVLLKGPYTVIAHPDGQLAVLPVATPALATAGTGDVLAGTITGLLAQGVAPFPAACLGGWLHGRAGELCEADLGPAGVVAGDLLPRLPQTMNELRV